MPSPAATKRVPEPVDVHVGNRVRMRRLMFGMNQEKLGHALGLTFQQVQKYEKGMNRMGSSRLQQIANILQMPSHSFLKTHLAKPSRMAKLPHQPMCPISSPRQMGLRSRKLLCRSKMQSSGEAS